MMKKLSRKLVLPVAMMVSIFGLVERGETAVSGDVSLETSVTLDVPVDGVPRTQTDSASAPNIVDASLRTSDLLLWPADVQASLWDEGLFDESIGFGFEMNYMNQDQRDATFNGMAMGTFSYEAITETTMDLDISGLYEDLTDAQVFDGMQDLELSIDGVVANQYGWDAGDNNHNDTFTLLAGKTYEIIFTLGLSKELHDAVDLETLGGSLQFEFTPTSLEGDPKSPVPEPGTMLLFGTCLGALAGARTRNKKRKKVIDN